MTTPTVVLRGVVEALQNSTAFNAGSYVLEEPDFSEEHNRMEQPIVSLQIVDNPRTTDWDSDLIGYVLDASNNPTGRKFAATWEMRAEVVVTIAAANPEYDVKDLGPQLQTALLPYDTAHEHRPFPHPDQQSANDDVSGFTVEDGTPEADLAGPGLRRWRQEFSLYFDAVRTTDDPQITTVHTPQTDELQRESTEDDTLVWQY